MAREVEMTSVVKLLKRVIPASLRAPIRGAVLFLIPPLQRRLTRTWRRRNRLKRLRRKPQKALKKLWRTQLKQHIRRIHTTAPETKGLTKDPKREWRFRNGPQGRKTKPKVSVIAWNMTHNPVGRAHWVAGALSRKFDVEIVGARFLQYGTEIWEPLRDDENVPTIDFVGQKFPAHFAEM